jgi:NAD(P)-dependent dehydrogenase (short-subunit alcohol dehydrogenase family)
MERAISVTPIHRTGTAQETAWLVMYLACEQAAGFITGQTFYIDGGLSLSGDLIDVNIPAKL